MTSQGPRELVSTFLSGSFVSVPFSLLARFSDLSMSADDLLLILQILAANQVQNKELPTLAELGEACHRSADEIGTSIEQLVEKGLLAIGERTDDNGFPCNYFDLMPLWHKLQQTSASELLPRTNAVTLFESEFGRPLSGFECEQIRQWQDRDGHPDWMIKEALREAVLANTYSFRYIDRVLYDWHRNRIRTEQELEAYRQSYRERQKAREEAAAGSASIRSKKQQPSGTRGKETSSERDERYAAFYQLFPDP